MKLFFTSIRLFVGVAILSGSISTAWAQRTWAFDAVSPAIYQLNQPASQLFTTDKISHPPAAHTVFQGISVQVQPSTGAWVESQLCTADHTLCQPIPYGRLFTHSFNHVAASSPLVVVHLVRDWRGSYAPVYVKTQLTVWWQ